jgi:hypothetical protein
MATKKESWYSDSNLNIKAQDKRWTSRGNPLLHTTQLADHSTRVSSDLLYLRAAPVR